MNLEIRRDGVFAFVGYWPDEILAAIQPLLVAQVWLVPPWCREVCVLYETVKMEKVGANCAIDFSHRIATLRFGPVFLLSDDTERRTTVIHELLHISTMVLSCNIEDAIREQHEEGLLRSKLLAELEEREEWTIADLSRAIAQKFS